MSLSRERIQYLLKAYTENTASDSEEKELLQHIAEVKDDAELKEYMYQLWLDHDQVGSGENPKVNWDEMLKKIIGKDITPGKPANIVSIKWRWIAAAAAIALLFGTLATVYFISGKNNPENKIFANSGIIKDAKAPVSSRATLFLGNGQHIAIDSASSGTLAMQGNIKVVKNSTGSISYEGSGDAVVYNTLSNPKGSNVINLALADGSQVWLNAASSITFPTSFVGDKREVKITGEAYFEVAHNEAKPFHVKVNDMEVQVLGTHFNINAYADERMIKTTLFEGSVNVSHGNESVRIKPGQQAIINNVPGKIQIKDDVDLEAVGAWKNGKFIFQNEDIFSIMRKLERWYNVDVTFKGNVTKEDFIGIISSKVNLSQILRLLEQTGTVKFSVIGKNVLVQEVK